MVGIGKAGSGGRKWVTGRLAHYIEGLNRQSTVTQHWGEQTSIGQSSRIRKSSMRGSRKAMSQTELREEGGRMKK